MPVDVVVNPEGARRGAAVVRRELDSINRAASGVGNALKTALAVGGITVGIQSFRQFTGFLASYEDQVARVAAVSGAAGADLANLTDEFEELGRTTRFSARQAAEGAQFLAQAGFDTNAILESLDDTLLLASAGGLSLAESADIASNVLSGFRLEVSQTERVVNVLAAASANSNTNVQQLGQAMSFVAPVSASLNISLEETTALLGVLADNGVQATRGATGLRGALASLQAPSDAAREVIEGAGLALEDLDANGESIIEVFETLAEANLSVADTFDIFGRENATAALILQNSTDDVRDLLVELGLVDDAAQDMSDTMEDTLGGAARSAGSAIQGFGIELNDTTGFSEVLKQSLRGLTQILNSVTSALARFNANRRVGAAIRAGGDISGFSDQELLLRRTELEQQLESNRIGGRVLRDDDPRLLRRRQRIAAEINTLLVEETGRALDARTAEIVNEALDEIPIAETPTSAPSGGGGGGRSSGGGASAADRAAEQAAREAERQRELNQLALERARIRERELDLSRQLLEAQFQENDSLAAQVRTQERVFRIQQEAQRAREGITDATALALIQQNEEFAIATEQLRLEQELLEIFREQQEQQRELFEERLAFLDEITGADDVDERLRETGSITDELKGQFQGLGSTIRDVFEGGEDAVNRFFDNLIDRASDTLLDAAINQLFGLFGGGGGGPFLPLSVGGPTSGGFTGSFSGAFNPSSFSVGSIPILDNGAVVSGPTLALLAANNRPEAVVPLPTGGGMARGGGSVINVTLEDSQGNQETVQAPAGDLRIIFDQQMTRVANDTRSTFNAAMKRNARDGRFR